MHDRQPTPGQEGRMLITPENGAPAFFAKVQMADNPLDGGTPLNTATFLKQQTASLFGLDADAVPNDAFALLGKYNQHWWERTVLTEQYGYKEVRTLESKKLYLNNYRGNESIQYAETIDINQETGEVILVNPETFTITNAEKDIDSLRERTYLLKGKYFSGVVSGSYTSEVTDTIYYVPAETSPLHQKNSESGKYDTVWIPESGAYEISSQLFNYEPGEKDIVWSTDRNAYPDSGSDETFKYEYLGIPFSNAVTAPKVEIGSYVGTGLYGAANPNKITLSIAPEFVIVSRFTGVQKVYLFHRNSSSYSIGYAPSTVWSDFISEWVENTLTWYSDVDSSETSLGTTYQANQAGATYYYIAFGKVR